MRLHKLSINGFKRLHTAEIEFGNATFLIGANNAGKSSVLKAIGWLLSNSKRMDIECFCSELDEETGETKTTCDTVILEAEFRNVPEAASSWRGFKGRIFSYDPKDTGETGKSIFYRKTYKVLEDVKIELKTLKRTMKPEFADLQKPADLIAAGASPELIAETFAVLDKKISASDRDKLELIDELWETNEEEEWALNPGGIGSVVLSKLPSILIIPADSASHEIDQKNGVLQKILHELFKDVRESSANYKDAQACLSLLAKELDPSDAGSEFGKMMGELNTVLGGVFPESRIYAAADLSSPDSLVPTFAIEMSSNIRTSVANQGTGMVRAAVFGLLRFRQQWLKRRDGNNDRGLIIGFEEPEIYLHPSAANQMRDLIYDLSDQNSQIVATTHSPYLIDLSRKPKQVLNRFQYEKGHTSVLPFSVSEEFIKLQSNDKDQVKMLIKLDDHVSRIFFTRRVLVVEGDTEEVVIKEAIRRMPPEMKSFVLSGSEIIKARGKASIIGLVKYLSALNVDFFVIHDRDKGTEGAEKFNEPIRAAVSNDEKLILMEECIEDFLGYPAPSSEKPFNAYKRTLDWGEGWDGVPEQLKKLLARVYAPLI
ncbi:ATP-dependent endonuclease [Pseudomonas cichorii]|uniref:ATP-dependent nuclease n=1 Tax=Pseudomonas cichorii TaxID=36746 RepID=UPI001C891370|nr:ATP-dependent endonuclease [Pseudomonas cichorii]MBX8576258.1 ATP-dependent endonuclease [Pseudomonas cichorii]